MSDNEFQPRAGVGHDLELDDPILEQILIERSTRHAINIAGEPADAWEAPIDLRVMRPHAIDLRKYWALTKQPVPPSIASTLGANTPILLNHVVTPFARAGEAPGGIWGIGYEFNLVPPVEANTVSVQPSDEVLKIARLGQTVQLGLDVGGGVGVPEEDDLEIMKGVQALTLSGASLEASTNQRFHMSLRLRVTLRKLVGGPVGVGGAKWTLYRQDERLDQSHALVQTLVVAPTTRPLRCVIKTWAKKAGWLGTGFRSRKWVYDDVEFEIPLTGLVG